MHMYRVSIYMGDHSRGVHFGRYRHAMEAACRALDYFPTARRISACLVEPSL